MERVIFRIFVVAQMEIESTFSGEYVRLSIPCSKSMLGQGLVTLLTDLQIRVRI